MDLTTHYLGLHLTNPLLPGASPMMNDLGQVKRLEDAGAAAIVMPSLFEEQIEKEQQGTLRAFDMYSDQYAEALSYFPEPEEFPLGPHQYLEQVAKIKQAVRIPVIASLNGISSKGWIDYGRLIQEAGADALELNLYHLATHLGHSSADVEAELLAVVQEVKAHVTIPLAVKLSPFFSSLANFAQQLDRLRVDGIVLFNRFYQPDIDVEALEVVPALHLSDSSELLLRLRWTAILYGRVRASLAVTGGVHTPVDVVKSVMAGASAVQTVSSLLRKGPEHLKTLLEGLSRWLEEHEYWSLRQMRGSMSLESCPDPSAYERANYMRVLHSWRPGMVTT